MDYRVKPGNDRAISPKNVAAVFALIAELID